MSTLNYIDENGHINKAGVIPNGYPASNINFADGENVESSSVRFPDYANADSSYSAFVSAGTTPTDLYTATEDCYILLYTRTNSTSLTDGVYVYVNSLMVCMGLGTSDSGNKLQLSQPIPLKKNDVVTISKDSGVSVADVRYKIIPIR